MLKMSSLFGYFWRVSAQVCSKSNNECILSPCPTTSYETVSRGKNSFLPFDSNLKSKKWHMGTIVSQAIFFTEKKQHAGKQHSLMTGNLT